MTAHVVPLCAAAVLLAAALAAYGALRTGVGRA